MRELNVYEQDEVSGGWIQVVMMLGGAAVWAFEKRAALVAITRAAKKRDEELTAAH